MDAKKRKHHLRSHIVQVCYVLYNKTSATIGLVAWEMKLEIMTDEPTNRPTDGRMGS